jgi:hypothetical protein
MCNIYKLNLFNPDIALFAVQKAVLNGGKFCHVYTINKPRSEDVYEKRKLF